MSANESTLGEVIRNAREVHVPKWGLRAFARILTLSPSYLSDIENDRRTPSEAVLRNIAKLLDLSFDGLMARTGRLGDGVERYIRRNPAAGLLLREIVKANLTETELNRLLAVAEELIRKRSRARRVS